MELSERLNNLIANTHTEMHTQLENVEKNLPTQIHAFLEDHQQTIFLSVFGLYKDIWGEYRPTNTPQWVKDRITPIAEEVLNAFTFNLNSVDKTRVTKAYKEALLTELHKEVGSLAKIHAKEIVDTFRSTVIDSLEQEATKDIDNYIKTLNFISREAK